jgi:AcrR family transcriptional regulator
MLDAAARLFGTQRFHEVRMDDIAAEAAVSKGTLYRHFQDKEQMYLLLLERASRQMLQRLEREVSPVTGARARLIAFVRAVIDFFDAQPHVFDLIQRAEVLRGPGRGFPWQQVRDEGLRLVKAVFAEGAEDDEIHVGDPELTALMLLGGLRAVIRFGSRPRRRDLAQRIVDTILQGADQSVLSQ